MNSSTIPLLVCGAHLGLGIPALMPAAGVMPVGGNDATEQMIDMNLQSVNGVSRPNGWVRRWQYSNRWLHSDLKDIAYYYVFNLYERLVQAGGLQ